MRKSPAVSCPPSPAHNSSTVKGNNVSVCADCSCATGVEWASLNRGVLLCVECCSVHRSLGRHISQVKYLRDGSWIKSQFEMVRCLASAGANAVWERSLLDPSTGLAATLSQAMKNPKKKPNPKDALHPNKSDFIRAKYQLLAFITRPNEGTNSLSDQLHSSVRTPNLKISLRLLASEKGNSPLHVAANSDQLLQIELLLVYGADPLAKDSRGNTPFDISIMNNTTEIAERLRAAPYDLTDRLSTFALGLKGIHETGHHIVHPDTIDDSFECSMISKVSNTVFEELSKDVLDEVDRRELNQAISSDSGIDKKLILPFLPVNNSFSSTRNQGRQKLATLNLFQFKSLVLGVLKESFRRIMRQPVQANGHNNHLSTTKQPNNAKDSEPLYDCVPSSENSDEESLSLSRLEKQWSQNSLKKNESLSGEEYSNLHGKLMRSDHLVKELVSSNKDMRGEIGRLQTMVQKLIDENAQLRTIVITKTDLSAKCETPRASPPMAQPRKAASPQPFYSRHPLGKDELNVMSSSWTSGSLSHGMASKRGLPSKEEVFQKTEVITKRIQGLLSLAQEGKTESFLESSNKIGEAVQQMVSLFPDDLELPDKVNQSLADLRLSALKLKTETSRPGSRLNSPAHGSIGRDGSIQSKAVTQQIIQNAFDIAKAAKCLVSLFQ